MALLNQVHLVGRAGRDPEVRYFESGNVLCTVTLAVNRIRRKGEQEDQPDWSDLEIWGKTAEIASEYVRKGSLIGISGALAFNRWSDRTTQQARERPVIKVDQLELLGRAARPDEPESF
ncbi:single-stranded DNA-binding protein [Gloeobacter violaceus]|uniref:Single-stranded DNA-binding protein n=1 Tax=Gloeobacter violaceus (strain ATCC 29082 / PCC 7421) TaxID=251221 RepID=Q7NHP8_GLOVI|nr:single-stranded DNA-binding protein [Gloeobacter violaceus]BAC90428.1 single-stranded DNA-binding protein [Gloeobacter violaceus PCC 7421]